MSTDSIRYNLVTSFACAQCGGKMALTYNNPKARVEYEPHKDDGITGAAKVDQKIFIHPCQKCYGEVTRPLMALQDALAAIAKKSERAA